jgi:N-acetylglucosaminyl-diphospho-decaprenol L-rhamnosyltransferase
MSRFSLIILNWNGRDHLVRCLESIKAQNLAGHEVIVVDNASVDDSIQVARQVDPSVVIIQRDTNNGFCEPNNRAAHQAKGDYLIFVNNDIVLGPDFFSHLDDAIRTHSPTLLAVRMLQLRNPQFIDNCGIAFSFYGVGRQRLRGQRADCPEAMKVQEGVIPSGACCVIRREVFLTLGGFDEMLFFNTEDVDLGLRALQQNHRCVYTPFPTVLHYGSASADVVGEKTYYFIQRNMELVFARNAWGIGMLFQSLPHFAYVCFQGVKAVRASRLKLFLRAKADAVKMSNVFLNQHDANSDAGSL